MKADKLPHNVPIKFDPNKLEYHPMFTDMFKRDQSRIKNIAESIKKHGYDPAYAIRCIIISGKVVVFDGHHKTEGGKLAGKNVIIIIYDLTPYQAYLDAREKQGNSRKLDNSELFKHVLTSLQVNNYKFSPSGELNRGQIKQAICEGLNVGSRTIDRCYKIIDDGSQEQKEKILSGKKTINAVYNEIMNNQKPKKKQVVIVEWKKDSLYITGKRILIMNPGFRYGKQNQYVKMQNKIAEVISDVLK